MSATDELRALLDERGVEHFDHEEGEPLRDLSEAGPDPATSWLIDNASVCAVPNKNGTFDLWIDHVTPAQAIAATLGRGTCTMAHEDGNDTWWSCNECDADVYLPTRPKFCFNCGREVVDG